MTNTQQAIRDWEGMKTTIDKSTDDPVTKMIITEKAFSYAQGLVENISLADGSHRKKAKKKGGKQGDKTRVSS